ncbi:MAG: type I secretion system permease/ATPase [Burkholderiaceae bacterium]
MTPLFKTSDSELGQLLDAFRATFRHVGVFSAVINLLMLAPSIYMLQVFDRVLTSRNETTLFMLTLMVLGTYLLTHGLEFIRGFTLIRLGEQMDARLSRRIYAASFQQNLKRSGGNAGQALNDLTAVRQFLTGHGLFAFLDAPWFPVYLVMIFFFDWILGLFAVGAATVLVVLAWANESTTRRPLAEANAVAVQSGNQATNNLRNAEVIEAMGMLPQLMSRWASTHGRFLQLQSRASDRATTLQNASKFSRAATQSLILGLGAVLALEERITPGMMMVGSILVGRALAPVDQLIGAWRQWSSARSAYQRLNELLENNPPRPAVMPLPDPTGHLELQGVSAAPPGVAAPTLREVSLSLVPGEVLGVIGPSGSGKSTLARVIMGVWSPAEGTVRIDNADLQQWNRDQLGPCLGYLPQDVQLFAGTIGENIARFGPIEPEKVIEAAQRAGVHEMILRLPKGYETVLGDGGAGLSGGQRQRLGLARAIYGNPSLLVLDEPNSNLDDAGEMALVNAIRAFSAAGSTVIIISHRTNVISATHKMLLLRDGRTHLYGPTAAVMAQLKAQARPGPRSGRTGPVAVPDFSPEAVDGTTGDGRPPAQASQANAA